MQIPFLGTIGEKLEALWARWFHPSSQEAAEAEANAPSVEALPDSPGMALEEGSRGQWRRTARRFALVLLAFSLFFVLWQTQVSFSHSSSSGPRLPASQRPPLCLTVAYPRLLTTDDVGGIFVTVLNQDLDDTFENLRISLVYTGTARLNMEPDKSSKVEIESLAPGARETKLIKFVVSDIKPTSFPFLWQQLETNVRLYKGDESEPIVQTVAHPVVAKMFPLGLVNLTLEHKITIPGIIVAIGSLGGVFKTWSDLRKSGTDEKSAKPQVAPDDASAEKSDQASSQSQQTAK
jgi:hypothetical protein